MKNMPNQSSPMSRQEEVIATSLSFLKHDPKHADEKPYKMRYDPGAGIPRENCDTEVCNILIQNIRGSEKQFTLVEQGFEVANLSTRMLAEQFYDKATVEKVYYQELKDLLHRLYRPTQVEILEHGIRKRHAQFPISTGETYEFDQPTTIAHVDYTPDSSLQTSKGIFNLDMTKYSRIQSVNIWKPIRGPVEDWPLAVCDATTTKASDLVATDIVYRETFTENYNIRHSARHDWYFLGAQAVDELIVFRQADTDPEFAAGVPHTSFDIAKARGTSPEPRESIEVRAFLYY